MGVRQRNSATLLALLGLGSILGANGSWLFGAMEEREEDYRRALQPRQFVQCSTGSKACGVLGCVASRRCCNADAGWGCLAGNACYTANGFVDCYSTTMVMPTVSRKCYDFTQSGCTIGQACFKCASTAALCATEVIAGGGITWLECATKSTVLTVTASIETASTTDTSTPTDDATITPVTGRTTTSVPAPTRTSTTATSSPSNTSTPDGGLSGGAIAGIVIGAVAGIAILAALIFFLCVKKGDNGPNGAAATPSQYSQPPQPPQPPQMSYPSPQPYSPPPQQQQQYVPQPQYSHLPGYQGQMAHNGYGPDGQPIAPPLSSPVYPEPSKQPTTMPAELH